MKNEFMKVPIFTGNGKVSFEERKIPVPGDNQLLIQAKNNLLCGWPKNSWVSLPVTRADCPLKASLHNLVDPLYRSLKEDHWFVHRVVIYASLYDRLADLLGHDALNLQGPCCLCQEPCTFGKDARWLLVFGFYLSVML